MQRILHRTMIGLMAFGTAAAWLPPMARAQDDPDRHAALGNVADLSLEELGDVVVVSVSRRAQPLLEAPASVYVITGDEIRRSGVTSLPEALRLAPNLQVAALDARQYAITARGFNSNIANKLLVMIDGRTVYSPLFSGVFWDAQDFVAADVDRIEVISGPAGATWGTNAVNGVINVVTRAATETLGPSVTTTFGDREQAVVARHGFAVAQGAAVRAHVRHFRRDATLLRSGGDNNDATRGTTAGIRADGSSGASAWSLVAGAYESSTDPRPIYGPVDLSGAHLLARWSRRLSRDANVDLQGYYDRSERKDRFLLQEDGRLLDVEAKLRVVAGAHRWLFGAGYRHGRDRALPGVVFAFLPPEQRLKWYSAFVQDEIALTDRLAVTLGTRLERNPYTGWEVLPSIRVGWRIDERSLAWGALSRAVRSPARLDREIFTPPQPPFGVAGGPGFVAEVANVAEIGWRGQRGSTASWSVTGFVHDFDRLRSAQIEGGTVIIANGIAGQVRGIEAWGQWLPHPDWRIAAGLLWLDKALRLKPGSNDPVGPSNLGNDPRLQWSVRSTHAVGERTELVVAVRRVGRLPRPEVPSYVATDLQLNWRLRRDLQVSLGVRNAFDRRHVEYDIGPYTGEIPRAAFVSISYQPL